MALAFSSGNMKSLYPDIRGACEKLIKILREKGPGTPVEFDNALSRQALDVIGVISSCFSNYLVLVVLKLASGDQL